MKHLQKIFGGMCQILRENNLDWVHLNIGTEGSGKTTLSFHLCELANPNLLIDDITFGVDEFINRLDTAPIGEAISCDEGGDAFMSAESLTRRRIEAKKQLLKIREKNFFICINISDISLLDRYLKTFRVRSMTRVKMSYKNGVIRRGLCEIYTRKQVRRIYKNPEGVVKFPQPAGMDSFPIYKKPLWEEYLKKKYDYLRMQKKKRELPPLDAETYAELRKQYPKLSLPAVDKLWAKKNNKTSRTGYEIRKKALQIGLIQKHSP